MDRALGAHDHCPLRQSVRRHLLSATLVVLVCTSAMLQLMPASGKIAASVSTLLVAGLWGTICFCLWRALHRHPHDRFGPANMITLYRAAGSTLLLVWLPGAHLLTTQTFWALTVAAAILLALDGVDGYLARRTGLGSDFGARFDMEVDALLILILCLLLWRSGETGVWILILGATRYAFLLAAHYLVPLQRNLYPSFRRKLVCVIQVATLCVLMTPVVGAPLSNVLAGIACVLLLASFARDIRWLLARAH